jgi:D-serine deaminase-like pyridoxal phosphate-dependent protein
MSSAVTYSRHEIGQALDVLETPCLVLEKSRLIANVAQLKRHLQPFGVRLRPHLKTAKGAMVRIFPNHACATGAQHDRYYVVDHGRTVSAIWPRIHGW